MKNTVLREKHLPNGLVIRLERQANMFKRVCVYMDEPLEDYGNVFDKVEAESLIRCLTQKYTGVTKEEILTYGLAT